MFILEDVAEQQLLPAGYRIQVEENHPDDFGGFYVIYAFGGHEVRFVWDGKDGFGSLSHREGGSGSWKPVGSPIPEGNSVHMREVATFEWPDALASVLIKPDTR